MDDRRREIPYFMAYPAGAEPPDSLAHDALTVAFGIAVLLVIFALSSWLP